MKRFDPRLVFTFSVALLLNGTADPAQGVVNQPPSIAADISPGTALDVHDTLRFSVRAFDPDGDLVSLRLSNPPPGLSFRPLTGVPSGSASEVRWVPTSPAGGLHHLHFVAHDDVQPDLEARLTVTVRVDGARDLQGYAAGLLVGDVTGDGRLDVVAQASQADVGGLPDAGALYVWKGRTGPMGAPDAQLIVPSARPGDLLGDTPGQGVQLADVSGDGVLDVVAATSAADPGGVFDAGAIYVWNGGAALSGTSPPTAVLTVPGARPRDRLASTSGQGLLLVDVTGDAVADVVAGSPTANVGGVRDVGALYVWKGGAGLAGASAPTATLTVPGARREDRLGELIFMQAVRPVDVTGDGVLDLVVADPAADYAGKRDGGAVFVWKGGPGLVGAQPPLASLSVPGARAWDRLGNQGVEVADVTGDGVCDIAAVTSRADHLGVRDSGAVYVWHGGAALVGSIGPSATLGQLAPRKDDQLGNVLDSKGALLIDLNSDGVRDVIVGGMNVTVGVVEQAGAVFVWRGGPGLTGVPGPLAALTVADASPHDWLGYSTGRSMLVGDVTGDGRADLVVGASEADLGGVPGCGAIYVWAGGPGFGGVPQPSARLTVSGAAPYDRLGFTSQQGLQLADLTGDGVDDVLASAPLADPLGLLDAGAVYVWAGGPALNGPVAPTATLAGSFSGDGIGIIGMGTMYSEVPAGLGVLVGDVSDDGVADVVVGAWKARGHGTARSGSIHVWAGGAALAGVPPPTAFLAVQGALDDDELGSASGQGIQLADVDGDSRLDVIAGARHTDLGDAADAGAVYVWPGGSALVGTPVPRALAVPGSAPQDALGEAGSGYGILAADVNGRSQLDLIVGSCWADLGGVQDAGALRLWKGPVLVSGPPSATLAVPGAAAGDQLGQ